MKASLPCGHSKYKLMHLSKNYQREERILKKISAKTDWYINKNENYDSWKLLIPKEWRIRGLRQRRIQGIPVSTVMTVPNTADSELLNALIK